MRTALLASVSALAFATSAVAADLAPAYKAPPPVPVLPTWAGFYLGIQGGLAQNYTTWTDLDALITGANSNNLAKTGGIFGGYAGYNWQDRSLVLGVETDGHWVGAKASQTLFAGLPGFNTAAENGEVRWVGSFRGRAGLDFESTLFYLTGGVAYGGVRDNVTWINGAFSGFPPGSTRASFNLDQTRVGWTAGAGIEHLFSGSNWTARAEVRYTDLGSTTVNCTNGTFTCSGSGFGTYRANFTNTLWTGVVGIGYKF
jgi:outer membrane immunogenic protein